MLESLFPMPLIANAVEREKDANLIIATTCNQECLAAFARAVAVRKKTVNRCQLSVFI